jgi:putative thioredoxin
VDPVSDAASLGPAAGAFEAPVIEVTDQDFAEAVIEESKRRPVVVDFWADWCQPCRVLGPVLEKVATEKQGAFLLAKLDVDANRVTSQQFQVQSIPNVWAFVDGKPVDQFIGAMPEPAVREWIDKLLPSEADRGAERAMEAEREGRLDDAEAAYREALGGDPNNGPARLGLARVLAARGDLDAARELATPLLPDPEAMRLLAAIRVSEWSKEDPSDPLGRAKAAAAQGEWGSALEQLLEIVKDHLEAREAMLDVFAVLGDDDPLTREYRPKLAAALF